MQTSKHSHWNTGTEKDTYIGEKNGSYCELTYVIYHFYDLMVQKYIRGYNMNGAFVDWAKSQSQARILRDTFINKSLQTPFVD